MHTDALANVYARSLFDLAMEAGGQGKIEEVNDELEQIVELARERREFARFLASPIVDRDARAESIRRIFDGRITDLTLRFLLILNDKGRLDRLEAAASAFDVLVQEAFGRVEVDVYTASVIGEDARSFIRDRIRTALGREPVLHTYADPDMIGGIKLRIGDRLIDGSVETRLRRLRSNLLESGAELRAQVGRLIQDDTGGAS
jgi:F-type H+-transporting ATPase subunit delta